MIQITIQFDPQTGKIGVGQPPEIDAGGLIWLLEHALKVAMSQRPACLQPAVVLPPPGLGQRLLSPRNGG